MHQRLDRFTKAPKLEHLRRLTTDFGIIQHADLSEPNPKFGYSIDDQARALIVCLWYAKSFSQETVADLLPIYFRFLEQAQTETGDFHNFYGINQQPLDDTGSPDSFGRTLWALAETTTLSKDPTLISRANKLLAAANSQQHLKHRHLRTRAYLALAYASLGDHTNLKIWADELIKMLNSNATPDWYWFEHELIYCNAIPVYALACAYEVTGHQRYLTEAKKTFTWLDQTSRIDGIVAPIGQDGWYHQTGDKAHYDQQPVDAAKMVMAALKIYQLTNDNQLLTKALEWFDWYSGKNTQKHSLVDASSGGIYDALTPTGVNQNEGAESIVTYLMAYLELSALVANKA